VHEGMMDGEGYYETIHLIIYDDGIMASFTGQDARYVS